MFSRDEKGKKIMSDEAKRLTRAAQLAAQSAAQARNADPEFAFNPHAYPLSRCVACLTLPGRES